LAWEEWAPTPLMHLAEQYRSFLLIDFDVVNPTNLNRSLLPAKQHRHHKTER
jgi:hypothetical protein